ncbi:hypotheticial protein [Blumeria hordei DH14]|uniref:Hypotheticial protein n=1 Tax=Blumeria graminis f. sp. hordei (strain DH14) TaxID=546991 RepID=N1JQ89_BLUG1|nr:hypotheticial protein [Blumeria hordei DH14]
MVITIPKLFDEKSITLKVQPIIQIFGMNLGERNLGLQHIYTTVLLTNRAVPSGESHDRGRIYRNREDLSRHLNSCVGAKIPNEKCSLKVR